MPVRINWRHLKLKKSNPARLHRMPLLCHLRHRHCHQEKGREGMRKKAQLYFCATTLFLTFLLGYSSHTTKNTLQQRINLWLEVAGIKPKTSRSCFIVNHLAINAFQGRRVATEAPDADWVSWRQQVQVELPGQHVGKCQRWLFSVL